jgi:outer membrane protein assembly factor BamB
VRVRAMVLVAITVAFCSATAASADWPQFHDGPARLGVSVARGLRAGNLGRLRILWRHATGKSREGVNSSAAVRNGVVYIGSDDGRLYAMGARNGSVHWSRSARGRVRSSPAVRGGVVFVGSDAGWIQARKARNGKLIWQRHLGGVVSAPPLVAEHRVYIGSRGGRFYALRAKTGRVVWKRRTWSVWDAAAYRRGTVYVGSDQSKVFAFDADTGHRRWVTSVWGRVRGTPAVTRRRVFVGTDMGRVYSLARRSGAKRWGVSAIYPGHGFVRCAPTVVRGRVVVSLGLTTTPMDGKVKAFRARSGRLLWRAELADYSTSSPAYINGMLIVGSFDHRLYALHADTGREIWTSGWAYQGGLFRRGISSSPAISRGRIVVGVRDGSVYSLGVGR